MMSRRYRQINNNDEGDELSRVGIADDSGNFSKQQGSSSQQSKSIALESFHGRPGTDKATDDEDIIEKDGLSEESFMADYVEITYDEIQEEIQTEFREILVKESSIKRTCIHKGLVSTIIFLLILIIGIVFVELKFPMEGFRDFVCGKNCSIIKCKNNLSLCFGLRVIRSIGLFGLFAGLANWVFIALLFMKIPGMPGTGVFQRHHRDIIEGLRYIVLDVLFDENKLKNYVSGTNKSMQKALQLNQHFEALLESSATDKIIEMKIDNFLTSPQGLMLMSMQVNQTEARSVIQHHVKSLINKLSKIIYERLRVPGITDGGLKTEITRILEPRLNHMEPNQINQIIVIMIRKHLSWLIVWGNVFGALIGLLNEIIFIIVIKFA